jgi:sec-independent protein translocase protein TatA
MGNLGFGEIMLIVGVAVLLFGAGRIADIGKGLGQGIKNFKQGLKEAGELDDDKKKLPEKTPEVAATASDDKGSKTP